MIDFWRSFPSVISRAAQVQVQICYENKRQSRLVTIDAGILYVKDTIDLNQLQRNVPVEMGNPVIDNAYSEASSFELVDTHVPKHWLSELHGAHVPK